MTTCLSHFLGSISQEKWEVEEKYFFLEGVCVVIVTRGCKVGSEVTGA